MPTWGEILKELDDLRQQGNQVPFDAVRRKYLLQLANHTGRNTIIYSTKWAQPHPPQSEISIVEEDVQGFMEVFHGLKGEAIDLILHSPGGFPEATEAIVLYMRKKFSDVRIIIPQAAMSAATMLSCSADRIVMGKHSSLGPIDPQMTISTQFGPRTMPAQAILDQFDRAKAECQDPKKIAPWLPILSQYGPSLLVECQNALDLSRLLAAQWLELYMLKGNPNAKKIANDISQKLADNKSFKSHGRHIDRDQAKQMGFIIEDLEKDQIFQDLVLSVFHATNHTFNATPVVKIIENHNGKAFLKTHFIQQLVSPPQLQPLHPAPVPAPQAPQPAQPAPQQPRPMQHQL